LDFLENCQCGECQKTAMIGLRSEERCGKFIQDSFKSQSGTRHRLGFGRYHPLFSHGIFETREPILRQATTVPRQALHGCLTCSGYSVSSDTLREVQVKLIHPMPASLTYQVAPFDGKNTLPRPAVFLLHGRGANEEDLLGLVPYLDAHCLCIAPRAPFPFSYGGYMWYDTKDIAQPDEKQFNESCDRLSNFIREMQKEYPLDSQRIYVFGFSMGAVMAYALALTRTEMIRGVIAHSGYWPGHLSSGIQQQRLLQPRFFVAHGTYDPVIPIEYARQAKELLTEHKAQFEYHEYPIHHEIGEQSLHDLSQWLTNDLRIRS
jgi:phospholipase/carboxylesterase